MDTVANSAIPPLSLYVHIPWCIQKCPYCDFNSHAVKTTLDETYYIDALLFDLQQDLQLLETVRPIHSVFIGGGTPSLFSARSLEKLLKGLQQQLVFSEDIEITLEANPGTFESNKFADFYSLGINRLSIGIQSFNDRHLKALGRIHDAGEAVRAVETAYQSGFDNINLDLMFGLPDQHREEAVEDVEKAISLMPAHISFYQLTLEPNTWFYKYPPKLPEDDELFQTQKYCQNLLAEHGYRQYEVSAYAQAGRNCRHNSNYWRFGDYLGIGAGAHGKVSLSLPDKIIRTAKCKKPEQYMRQKDYYTRHQLELKQLPLEFVMNHLRLKSGFSTDHYQEATGLILDTLEPGLTACLEAGLLVREKDIIRCSDNGWDFLDTILEKFIA